MEIRKYNSKFKHGHKKVYFSGCLLLFIFISSTTVMAATTSSIDNTTPKLIIAPENPEFVTDQENQSSSQAEVYSNGHKLGFKPGPVSLRHLRQRSNVQSFFPAYYDLRTLNKVTPVKDQGNAGTCWAFATYGSLESYLMPYQKWDFSENNLKNVLSDDSPEGFDRTDGGNEFMSTAYLARWSGPVTERKDPYSDSSSFLQSELRFHVTKHVQNVLFIPDRTGPLDNNAIKSAIMKYGAIDTTMYMDQEATHSYYNPDTYSYHYDGSGNSNHAVAIVGWNDRYDRNKFAKAPPGDGAFIVKNSWGTSWGDKGYFYVSYYDSNIGKYNAMFTAVDNNVYSKVYQYDPLGQTTDVGLQGNDGNLLPTCWCANVFTAFSNKNLAAVSFYTTDSKCNYEIYINTNSGSIPISQLGLIPDVKGTFDDAGYHTVNLKHGIRLKAGQKFSIVLKLTNSDHYYPIALEYPLPKYSSKATASPGQSFFSADGKTWYDLTDAISNTNVCIKAFS